MALFFSLVLHGFAIYESHGHHYVAQELVFPSQRLQLQASLRPNVSVSGGAATAPNFAPMLVPDISHIQGERSDDGIVFVLPELLTQKPVLLEDVDIDGLGLMEVLSGKVRLRLYLNPQGTVDYLEVVESTLPDLYIAVATSTFRDRRFSPGRIGGMAVATFTEIEIVFDHADGCCF